MSNNRPSPEQLGKASLEDACDLLFRYGPRDIFSMLRAARPRRRGAFIADVIQGVSERRWELAVSAGALPMPRTEPELPPEVQTDNGAGLARLVEAIPRQPDEPVLDARQRQMPKDDRE